MLDVFKLEQMKSGSWDAATCPVYAQGCSSRAAGFCSFQHGFDYPSSVLAGKVLVPDLSCVQSAADPGFPLFLSGFVKLLYEWKYFHYYYDFLL